MLVIYDPLRGVPKLAVFSVRFGRSSVYHTRKLQNLCHESHKDKTILVAKTGLKLINEMVWGELNRDDLSINSVSNQLALKSRLKYAVYFCKSIISIRPLDISDQTFSASENFS